MGFSRGFRGSYFFQFLDELAGLGESALFVRRSLGEGWAVSSGESGRRSQQGCMTESYSRAVAVQGPAVSSAYRNSNCLLRLLHHFKIRFGEVLAHEGKGFGAAEVMVAGIGGATFP